ncbi:RagB/SusD family nutrient uptake outer membrane protein [Chitinophaga sp. SYP-B3965]|uniref:RagB/SusD family nutrient uptake outer membrane protein n=1 Tax=Chitinophaga sp. SYP-B3965 TaxID=2663120 RepID=UPI001299DDC5|nr:RagB/SusD family nutrient uptake outer membrane protein [Chitinophaga sp. SYP-B3965]MRG49006.1 RagB/SusD family nutrient uptake outer membrane protein [Chitinophaga sp. SYP-B3965]
MKSLLFLALLVLGTGCEKFLNEKPDQKLVTPDQIKDLQALLDNEPLINQKIPRAAEMSADDYYLADASWNLLNEFDKRMYIWDKGNLFQAGSNGDWGNAYVNVNRANNVLFNIDKVDRVPGDQEDWNNLKGHALFLRGQAFLQVAFIWAAAYDERTADTDLGIPLRLDPDANIKTTRASLKQTYDQIISDLKMAAALLPEMPKHIIRPSKAAAYALLARTYLSMRKYPEMGTYANLSLQMKSTLKDFNSLQENPSTSFPFAPRYSNEEIITESSMLITSPLNPMTARIDSNLYASFGPNDLRKKMLFRSNGSNSYGFRGSYAGSVALFSGLATNEVYLMRAESYARAENIPAAMADLNKLLEKRFVINTFVPLVANTPREALRLIFAERRKELIMRGLRWMDVKRLNKEGEDIVLKRVVNNKTYVLPPNDPGYAMPIPEDVIQLTGVEQNPL